MGSTRSLKDDVGDEAKRVRWCCRPSCSSDGLASSIWHETCASRGLARSINGPNLKSISMQYFCCPFYFFYSWATYCQLVFSHSFRHSWNSPTGLDGACFACAYNLVVQNVRATTFLVVVVVSVMAFFFSRWASTRSTRTSGRLALLHACLSKVNFAVGKRRASFDHDA